MVFTVTVRKTGHVTKISPEIDNAATCTTNLRQIYGKFTTNRLAVQQIHNKSICLQSTTNLRLIAQMEFELYKREAPLRRHRLPLDDKVHPQLSELSCSRARLPSSAGS